MRRRESRPKAIEGGGRACSRRCGERVPFGRMLTRNTPNGLLQGRNRRETLIESALSTVGHSDETPLQCLPGYRSDCARRRFGRASDGFTLGNGAGCSQAKCLRKVLQVGLDARDHRWRVVVDKVPSAVGSFRVRLAPDLVKPRVRAYGEVPAAARSRSLASGRPTSSTAPGGLLGAVGLAAVAVISVALATGACMG
jgi:hypothetical protein